MIVADTNLIAYLVIQGQKTPLARAVLTKDPEWAAPVLWRSELLNVLALYGRLKHFSLADSLQLMHEAESLMQGREYRVESAPILRLADSSGCAAYDCEFVHLAQELGVPVVTSDQKVLRAFPGIAVSLEDFARS